MRVNPVSCIESIPKPPAWAWWNMSEKATHICKICGQPIKGGHYYNARIGHVCKNCKKEQK